MDKLTVLDLARCLFWGIFGMFPLGIAYNSNDEKWTNTPFFLLAIVFQITFGLALYIAGGKA